MNDTSSGVNFEKSPSLKNQKVANCDSSWSKKQVEKKSRYI